MPHPVSPSPQAKRGYHVAAYLDVDPRFGMLYPPQVSAVIIELEPEAADVDPRLDAAERELLARATASDLNRFTGPQAHA